MKVAIRDLKANLSRILTRAQTGESIEATSHNKLIARIFGIPSGTAEGLRATIGRGTWSWSGGNKPQLAPPVELFAVGTPVRRMVLKDRG